MGRPKKVPSRSAGGVTKFVSERSTGGANPDPGGSKAHVPALLEAPGQLV